MTRLSPVCTSLLHTSPSVTTTLPGAPNAGSHQHTSNDTYVTRLSPVCTSLLYRSPSVTTHYLAHLMTVVTYISVTTHTWRAYRRYVRHYCTQFTISNDTLPNAGTYVTTAQPIINHNTSTPNIGTLVHNYSRTVMAIQLGLNSLVVLWMNCLCPLNAKLFNPSSFNKSTIVL